MFGHQDQTSGIASAQDGVDSSVDAMLNDPQAASGISGTPSLGVSDDSQVGLPAYSSAMPTVTPAPSSITTMHSLPTNPSISTDLTSDTNAAIDNIASTSAVVPPSTVDASDEESANQALLSIKRGALQQLRPLVDHLDQTPEEKFRTTMMMIQGADDQSLIQNAYDAAQSITDEKTRAQALLDVVNEINYFTHK